MATFFDRDRAFVSMPDDRWLFLDMVEGSLTVSAVRFCPLLLSCVYRRA